MLVRFSSVKTDAIIMHGEVAIELIRMLGATGTVPGALAAADLPAAIQRLQQQLPAAGVAAGGQRKFTEARHEARQQDDSEADTHRESPIDLRTRAAPLLDLLQRAAQADAAVMWEAL